jgi:hypothetical protein
MRKTVALVVLLAAAGSLLPGCYFAGRVFPTDPSGMKYPAHWAAETIREQTRETAASITGIPGLVGRQFRDCWRYMAHNPSDL